MEMIARLQIGVAPNLPKIARSTVLRLGVKLEALDLKLRVWPR